MPIASGKEHPRYIREVFEKFDEDKKPAEIRNIIKKRMYLTGDRQFIENVDANSFLKVAYRENYVVPEKV